VGVISVEKMFVLVSQSPFLSIFLSFHLHGTDAYFFCLRIWRILRSSRSFGLPAACFIVMRSFKEA
ncbi:MAG: hypothetical protein JW755_10545, partial [Candidatus Aminicenantes bacterium]|nr:hypothetical protein [Candidatus Aminicenantes bacterium]